MMGKLDRIKNLIIGLRDLTIIGSTNIVVTLISGVFWFFIATLLGTEQFGKVSYFIAIATISYTISFLGSGYTVIVYTAKEQKIQSAVYFLALIFSVITAVAVFFIFYNIGVSLYVIGAVVFGLSVSEHLGRKLYKDFSKYVITQRILMVCLSFGLYFVIGWEGIILGFALSYFPYSVRIIKGFRESKIDMSSIKTRLRFIMNSYATDLTNALSTSLDKLIIFPLFGFALLGNYQLGMQFLLVLSVLPQTVYQYVLPKDASGIQNKKLKKATIFISIVFAILGILLMPLVIQHLFPQFDESIKIIQIMSLGIIPISINSMYNSKFFGIEKSKNVLIGSIISLSIQILGIFILGSIYGINGAAMALVLGASLQTIYLLCMSRTIQAKNN